MPKENNESNGNRSRSISRRVFIKIAAVTGFLAGCSTVEQAVVTPTIQPTNPPSPTDTPVPTDTPAPTRTPLPTDTLTPPDTPLPTGTLEPTSPPVPTDTPLPTDTPAPTATPTLSAASRRAEIIKKYPDVPSKVVWTHHGGVWEGDTLSPEAMRQMLDISIAELTGLADAGEAWSALFDPGERIAIKVNTINSSNYWTHVPLVTAVTTRLQDVDIPAEQIIIFDRYTFELENAGYAVNPDGPGVRCYGTDEKYEVRAWTILGNDVSLSPVLLNCDALINMPVLKQHGITGISFAMKNHYGSFNRPGSFHGERAAVAIPELNGLAPIRDRTRLIIGDVLTVVKSGWRSAVQGDSIFMSFDPVAHDTFGLQVYGQVMEAEGRKSEGSAMLANPYLAYGAELGLGTNDPDYMNVVEVNLT